MCGQVIKRERKQVYLVRAYRVISLRVCSVFGTDQRRAHKREFFFRKNISLGNALLGHPMYSTNVD